MPDSQRGFPGLRCPLCGQETTISVDLDDLSTFHCGEDCEFTIEDVRALLDGWTAVLAWIGNAPTRSL